MNDGLRNELEQLLASDHAVRKELWAAMQEHGPASEPFREAQAKMKVIYGENGRRLIEIVEEHGWPGLSQVGEEGAEGAFLLLQHADLDLQKKYLPLLRDAVAAGEADRSALPLLEDRVRMRDGEKQLYGSQVVTGADGKLELWPIEDEAHVDERRLGVGLPPLAEYLQRAGLGHLRTQGADGS